MEVAWLLSGLSHELKRSREDRIAGGLEAVRDETSALEKQVVLEGEDPRNMDRWRRSKDPNVERDLRIMRLRLGQLQKLRWRVEILAELGRELADAEAVGTELPAHATGVSRTVGALDYRDEMLAKWRQARESRP